VKKLESNINDEYARLKTLSEIRTIHHGSELFRHLEAMLNGERDLFEDTASCSDTNIKKDWRYLIGRISVLKEILSIPETSIDNMDKLRKYLS
jgi:hypothetical protein